MIIREVHLYHVRMPLLEPWVTAYGSRQHESLFVNLKFDDIEDGANAPCTTTSLQYRIKRRLLPYGIFLQTKLLAKRYQQLNSYRLYFKGSKVTNFRSAFDRHGGMLSHASVKSLSGH